MTKYTVKGHDIIYTPGYSIKYAMGDHISDISGEGHNKSHCEVISSNISILGRNFHTNLWKEIKKYTLVNRHSFLILKRRAI